MSGKEKTTDKKIIKHAVFLKKERDRGREMLFPRKGKKHRKPMSQAIAKIIFYLNK